MKYFGRVKQTFSFSVGIKYSGRVKRNIVGFPRTKGFEGAKF
jgi:hypothetical protein